MASRPIASPILLPPGNSPFPTPKRALSPLLACTSFTLLFLSLTPTPAHAVSLSFGDFTLVSGTDLQVGATYRFDDVTTGVDALISIDALTAGASLTKFDDSSTPGEGKYEYFQPVVGGLAVDSDYADFTVSFVLADTSTSTSIADFNLRAHDVDGTDIDNDSYEFLHFYDFDSYTVDNPTNIEDTIISTSPVEVKFKSILNGGDNGISLDPFYAVSAEYNSTSSFNLRLGLEGTRTSFDGRKFSLNMFDNPDPFLDPQVTPVPEPGTAIPLFLAALLFATGRRPSPDAIPTRRDPPTCPSKLQRKRKPCAKAGSRCRRARIPKFAIPTLAWPLFIALFLTPTPAHAANLSFTTFALESGTDLQAGATYRFDDVTTGVDALVSIDAFSSGGGLSQIDNSSPPGQGKYEYLQPTFEGVADDSDWADITVSFVLADTSTSTTITDFAFRAHDVDGNNVGGDAFEFLHLHDFNSYTIDNPTNIDPNVITTSPVEVKFTSILNGGPGGISLDPEYTVEVDYTNISSYSFRFGLEGDATALQGRVFALNMWDDPDPFLDPQVTPVPEPGTAFALLLSLITLLPRRRV